MKKVKIEFDIENSKDVLKHQVHELTYENFPDLYESLAQLLSDNYHIFGSAIFTLEDNQSYTWDECIFNWYIKSKITLEKAIEMQFSEEGKL